MGKNKKSVGLHKSAFSDINALIEKREMRLKSYRKLFPDSESRKKLFRMMGEHGMKQSTCYLRFFRDGFKPWEIKGIEEVIKEFDSSFSGDLSSFYQELPKKGDFIRIMEDLGMSRGTVIKRFRMFNFKEYELKGINYILKDYQSC